MAAPVMAPVAEEPAMPLRPTAAPVTQTFEPDLSETKVMESLKEEPGLEPMIPLPPTPLPTLAVAESTVPEPVRQISAGEMLSWCWLMGLLLVLAGTCWRQGRFARRVARLAQPASKAHVALLAELQRLTGQHQAVRLRMLPGLGTPAVFGWWRPQILLTEAAATGLNESELRHVLLHELSHIRRHDVLLNWALIFTRAVHWFNPLVWLSQRWLVRDRELLWDAQAMAFLSSQETPRDYGYTLLKLAMPGAQEPTTPSLAPLFHSSHELQRRIRMISQPPNQPASKWHMALSLLAVSALAIFTFTRAVAEDAPPSPKVPEVRRAEIVDSSVDDPSAEELAPVRAALDSFLAARTWQDRAKFTQQAERLRPQMEEFYAHHADGPIAAEKIDFLTTQPTPGGKSRFYIFQVVCGSRLGFPVSLEMVNGSYQVEWESFVEFKDLFLPKYFETFHEKPAEFRVVLRRTHYFGADIPNQDQKLCFAVEPPVAGHANYAWVTKANVAVLSKLREGGDFGHVYYPVVKLRWVKEGKASYVVLDDIVSDNWRADHPQRTSTPDPSARLQRLTKQRDEVKRELSELEASSKAGKDLRQEILALQKVARDLTTAYYKEKYLVPALQEPENRSALEKLKDELERELKELSAQGLDENHPDVSGLREAKGQVLELYYRAKYSLQEGDVIEVDETKRGAEAPDLKEIPFGTWVPDKRGFVYSPYAPDSGGVDVSDIPAGTKVECPYTKKIFRVPRVGQTGRYTVLGAVLKPGSYALPNARIDLTVAVGMAGGIMRPTDSIAKAWLVKCEAEVAKLKAQLQALSDIKDADQAIEVAAGITTDSEIMKESLPAFHKAKIELAQLLDGGLGTRHPSVVAARGQVEILKEDLLSGVTAVKLSLEARLKIAQAALQSWQETNAEALKAKPSVIRIRLKHAASVQALEGDLDDLGAEQIKPGDIITVIAGDEAVSAEAKPAATRANFTIIGEVKRPGTYAAPSGKQLTLTEAVGMAGGFGPMAERAKVKIVRRGVQAPLEVDPSRIPGNGVGLLIQDGDVIEVAAAEAKDAVGAPAVPQRGVFTVLGAVNKPGKFNFPPGIKLTLMEAVGMAGGFNKLTNAKKATLKRDGVEQVLELRTHGTDEVKAGDVVTIQESVPF